MDDEEMQGMSFGHAGTIVEGKEDSATEKIARLEAAGIPVVERIDEIPERVKERSCLRLGRMSPGPSGAAQHGVFIDVEVDASVASDPELAKKLEEACPVDIFAAARPASRSSRRTWTSACSAGSAWTPRPTATVTVTKLYDGTTLER